MPYEKKTIYTQHTLEILPNKHKVGVTYISEYCWFLLYCCEHDDTAARTAFISNKVLLYSVTYARTTASCITQMSWTFSCTKPGKDSHCHWVATFWSYIGFLSFLHSFISITREKSRDKCQAVCLIPLFFQQGDCKP